MMIPTTGSINLGSKCRCSIIWVAFMAITIIVWFGIIGPAVTDIAEQQDRPPDPVILPIPQSGDENNPYFVNVTSTRGSLKTAIKSVVATRVPPYDKHHRGYYLVTTNYPWSVVLPNTSDSNRSNTSDPSTPLLQKTSHQAANHNCNIVATNGGPFDKGGSWNSGPTVSKGRLVRTKPLPEDSQFFGFGISLTETPSNGTNSKKSANNRNWVMGQYGQLLRSSSRLAIWDFVTGFGWLVYDGKARVTHSHSSNHKNHPDPTGAFRAPRTAIGLDKDSNLMLLVVDGCQRW